LGAAVDGLSPFDCLAVDEDVFYIAKAIEDVDIKVFLFGVKKLSSGEDDLEVAIAFVMFLKDGIWYESPRLSLAEDGNACLFALLSS